MLTSNVGSCVGVGEKGRKKTDAELRERLRGWIYYYWSENLDVFPTKGKFAEGIGVPNIIDALKKRNIGVDILARVLDKVPRVDLHKMFRNEPPQVEFGDGGIPRPLGASSEHASRQRQ